MKGNAECASVEIVQVYPFLTELASYLRRDQIDSHKIFKHAPDENYILLRF